MKRIICLRLILILAWVAVGFGTAAAASPADPHAGHGAPAEKKQAVEEKKIGEEKKKKFFKLPSFGKPSPPDPHAGHGKPIEESKKAEEKKEVSGEPPGAVQLSPQRQQLIGVKIGSVQKRHLRKMLNTTGRVDYDEKKVVVITPKVGGWIEDLFVDFTGAFVQAGAPLLTLYSPELVSTQEEFLMALRARHDLLKSPFPEVVESGKSIAESARRRLKFWDISDQQIRELEESGQIKRALTFYSPYDGYVLEKMAFRGVFVNPGMPLFKLADISTVWIHADIYENELPLIRLGQNASVRFSYLPNEVFNGRAIFIYPSLDPKTRTAKVRFEFQNQKQQLKPEMYAEIEITIDLGEKLAVPEGAVIDTGRRQVVFIEKSAGIFEPREVKVGLKGEENYEVLKGLSLGERVVTSANFLIDSESKFKEVVEKMAGMEHTGHR